MMKRRTREHKSVHQGYRDANLDSLIKSSQHPAGGRSVDVNAVSDSHVPCGNHVGLTVDYETHVAKITFVQDRMNLRPVIDGPLGESLYLRTWRGSVGIHLFYFIAAGRRSSVIHLGTRPSASSCTGFPMASPVRS